MNKIQDITEFLDDEIAEELRICIHDVTKVVTIYYCCSFTQDLEKMPNTYSMKQRDRHIEPELNTIITAH